MTLIIFKMQKKDETPFKKNFCKNTKNSLGFKKFGRGEVRTDLLKRWQHWRIL